MLHPEEKVVTLHRSLPILATSQQQPLASVTNSGKCFMTILDPLISSKNTLVLKIFHYLV